MTESQITQAMAESGKMTQRDLMGSMKARHLGKYDLKLARSIAKRLVQEMKAYI